MPYPFSPGEILTATNLNNAIGVTATWSSPVNSGITVGNGVTASTYVQNGVTVLATYRLVLGGTSAITGSLVFNLPVNALHADAIGVSGHLLDAGTATYPVMVTGSTATTVSVATTQASGTYTIAANVSSTVPFTWASTDEINLQFFYQSV